MSKYKYIDLSHTIFDGLVTYKGLPAPIICDYLSRENSKNVYEDGTSFQIGKIEMVTNTGTYIDCPFHRYEDGKDLSEVTLERFVNIDCITIDATNKIEITTDLFKNLDVESKAVMINTGWSKHWNTNFYFENHPYLSEAAAIFLKEKNVKLVGIDSHNIDNTSGKKRPVHSILLAAEILIVEHLCNLNSLPPENYFFSAVPPKIRGAGTFPVRAFATIIE